MSLEKRIRKLEQAGGAVEQYHRDLATFLILCDDGDPAGLEALAAELAAEGHPIRTFEEILSELE